MLKGPLTKCIQALIRSLFCRVLIVFKYTYIIFIFATFNRCASHFAWFSVEMVIIKSHAICNTTWVNVIELILWQWNFLLPWSYIIFIQYAKQRTCSHYTILTSWRQVQCTMYQEKNGYSPSWQWGQKAMAYGPYSLFQDSCQDKVQRNK